MKAAASNPPASTAIARLETMLAPGLRAWAKPKTSALIPSAVREGGHPKFPEEGPAQIACTNCPIWPQGEVMEHGDRKAAHPQIEADQDQANPRPIDEAANVNHTLPPTVCPAHHKCNQSARL